MNSLINLSAHEMRQGLLNSSFSAEELVGAHLKEISKSKELNSFVTVCSEEAKIQAKAADKALRENKEQTPFFTGIPLAVKDMLLVEGVESKACSKILEGFTPPYSSTAVSKVTKQGGIIIGKTNMDEFAMGSSNENSAFGAVKNPIDKTRVPGGSSGGSAVAVAANLAPVSLGTDTGGSIRQPASFTGVYGMKPTYGRVSRYGAIAYASSLDQIGPFARTIEDLAITLEAISGFDPQDSTSVKEEVPSFVSELDKLKDLSGIRIGVPKEFFISGIATEVEDSIRESIKKLDSLGAEIVEISLPHTEYALAAYYIIALAEASSNLSRYDGIRYGNRPEQVETLESLYEKTRALGFGKEVKRRILLGTYVLSAGYYDAYYLKAQQVRTLIINDFKSAFSDSCDVILAPVSPTTAFKLGEKTASTLEMYLADVFTVPVNLAGLPGLSVPCGLDSNNLPISFQLIGKPFAESQMLQIAKVYSR